MRRPLIFTIFLILIIPTQGFSAGAVLVIWKLFKLFRDIKKH